MGVSICNLLLPIPHIYIRD